MDNDCDGVFIKEFVQKLSGEFIRESILISYKEETTPKKLFATFYFDIEIPLGLYYKIGDMIKEFLGESFVKCEHSIGTNRTHSSLTIHYISILYAWRRIK